MVQPRKLLIVLLLIVGSACSASTEQADSYDEQRRNVILEAAAEAQASVPDTTPSEKRSLEQCAGEDTVRWMDSETLRSSLTDEEWDLIESCIMEVGLEEKLIVTFELSDLPELVDLHNEETRSQIECLKSNGWEVVETEPDEDSQIFWEPERIDAEDPEFIAAADGCVS